MDIDDDLLGDTLLPYNASGNIENGGDYRPLLPCVNLSDSSTFYGRIDNSSGTYNVLKNVFLCEDTYYLNTSDIVLNFSVASQNISFDCSGSRIIGNNSGVFMNSNGMTNTTIKNCFVSNYDTVFNFNNTLYSYFYNNHANNSEQGLNIYNTTIEIDSSIFYNNTNDGIYIDENSNISLSLSRVCSNSIDINSNTTLSLGNYNRCDSFLNWTESGRRGCALTCSDIWHRFTGKVEGNLILSDNIATFYLWDWTDLSGGNIYAVNSESNVDWMQMYSIGRKTDNTTSSSDFEILDNILALPDSMDNINYTYSIDGSMPKITTNMTLFERDVLYIPIANSTFLGLYQTGILWDGSDAAGDEFTGSEDVIFVGDITYTAEGTYVDNISYEIMLPKNFDIYTDPGAEVYFYVELK